MSCHSMQSARISDREVVTVTPFRPPKGFETLLLTAVLGFMRPVPPTHKQELDALALTTHLIRLFRDQVLALPHKQESPLRRARCRLSVSAVHKLGAPVQAASTYLITLLAFSVPSFRPLSIWLARSVSGPLDKRLRSPYM